MNRPSPVTIWNGARSSSSSSWAAAAAHTYVPSYRVDHVVDTVGAGDGFAVGFTSAWLEGLSMEKAARRGAAVGAMVIQVAGDNEGLPTREQLAAFQNEQAE